MTESNKTSAAKAAADEPSGAIKTEATPTNSDSGPQPTADVRATGSGRGLTLVALVLALTGLGLIGWFWWQQPAVDERVELDALSARVDALASDGQRALTQIDALNQRMTSLESGLEGRIRELETRPPAVDESRLEAFDRRDAGIEARLDALEQDLAARIDTLSARLEAQTGQPETDFDEQVQQHHRELVLHEAASLLRIGQGLAELGDDRVGARQAYDRAAARLLTLDDRRAARLREAVVREAELLAASSGPDWVEAVGQIAALSTAAADWPLVDQEIGANDKSTLDEAGDSEGWWSGIGRALGSLVKVTSREQAVLPDSVVESLRERLQLYLAAAEVAAARRNAAELAQHAQAALELLELRFNTLDPAVKRASEVLAGLAHITASERPDLGAALAEIERSLEAR